MIRIPISSLSSTDREISLEPTEYGTAVVLTVELEDGETIGRSRPIEKIDEALVRWRDEGRDELLEEKKLKIPQSVRRIMVADLFRLVDEVERLRRIVDNVDRRVDRELLPHEARELAAGLVHYAAEGERLR